MNFLHNDLGYLNGGEVIEVNLDHAANVRLMDASNFQSYRQGARYRCFGGEARQSPIRLRVPQPCRWVTEWSAQP